MVVVFGAAAVTSYRVWRHLAGTTVVLERSETGADTATSGAPVDGTLIAVAVITVLAVLAALLALLVATRRKATLAAGVRPQAGRSEEQDAARPDVAWVRPSGVPAPAALTEACAADAGDAGDAPSREQEILALIAMYTPRSTMATAS